MARKKEEKLGWFSGGGFEKDPFLTKEDKRYYRKEKERKEKSLETHLRESDWL